MIHKTKEIFNYNKICDFNDDKVINHLLGNVESTGIMVNYVLYYCNTEYFMRSIPSETDVIYSQYKEESASNIQDNTDTFILRSYIYIWCF